ncbi:hypothetical protein [Shewanella sp. P1-14-1]|nr:hypothetical protein [Shewanella sp. P1-14-1]
MQIILICENIKEDNQWIDQLECKWGKISRWYDNKTPMITIIGVVLYHML